MTSRGEPDPWEGDEWLEEASVRPYAVTGGRTRSSGAPLPIEALVSAMIGAAPQPTLERRRIIELSSDQYLSIAELSAHVHLPVGVVRVIVGDLIADGLVRVHGLTSPESSVTPATTLSILESVLNGISAL